MRLPAALLDTNTQVSGFPGHNSDPPALGATF
jgi:hypothetical protein